MNNDNHFTPDTHPQGYVQEAKYTPQQIPEYSNNRYIEALPEILCTPSDFFTRLKRLPVVSSEQRQLPEQLRLHFNSRFHDFFIPNSLHYHIHREVDVMIRQGYVQSATVSSPAWRTDSADKYGATIGRDTSVRTLVLVGNSGCGKTKLMSEILSRYPRLILHSEYNGRACLEYQIPYLKIEIPPSADIKNLCISICRAIDDLFPNSEPSSMYATKTAAKRQIDYVNKLLLRHKVGLLVIDEIQNIQHLSNSATRAMLDFLLQLQNTISTPMVWLGTHEVETMLSGTLKHARRASSCIFIKPYENDIQWSNFVKALVKISVTDTEYTDELADCLYEKSCGMPATAIALFEAAQTRAVLNSMKCITTGLLDKVAKDSIPLLSPALNAMRRKDIAKLRQLTDLPAISDIFTKPTETIPQSSQGTCLSAETIEAIEKRARIESRLHKMGIAHNICKQASDKVYQGANIFRLETELLVEIRDVAIQLIKEQNNLREMPQDLQRPKRSINAKEKAEELSEVRKFYEKEYIENPE